MRRLLLIYDFAPDPSEFPNIWGKFYFLFYQCGLSADQSSGPGGDMLQTLDCLLIRA
jgi:hypothetical protein